MTERGSAAAAAQLIEQQSDSESDGAMSLLDMVTDASGYGAEPPDLTASRLITQRPRTEMHAIVAQDSIAGFPYARSRALHDFSAVEAPDVTSHADRVAASELLERNILNRAASQSVGQARVVNDAAAADIDAMMTIQQTRGNKMGGERRLLAKAQA